MWSACQTNDTPIWAVFSTQCQAYSKLLFMCPHPLSAATWPSVNCQPTWKILFGCTIFSWKFLQKVFPKELLPNSIFHFIYIAFPTLFTPPTSSTSISSTLHTSSTFPISLILSTTSPTSSTSISSTLHTSSTSSATIPINFTYVTYINYIICNNSNQFHLRHIHQLHQLQLQVFSEYIFLTRLLILFDQWTPLDHAFVHALHCVAIYANWAKGPKLCYAMPSANSQKQPCIYCYGTGVNVSHPASKLSIDKRRQTQIVNFPSNPSDILVLSQSKGPWIIATILCVIHLSPRCQRTRVQFRRSGSPIDTSGLHIGRSQPHHTSTNRRFRWNRMCRVRGCNNWVHVLWFLFPFSCISQHFCFFYILSTTQAPCRALSLEKGLRTCPTKSQFHVSSGKSDQLQFKALWSARGTASATKTSKEEQKQLPQCHHANFHSHHVR